MVVIQTAYLPVIAEEQLLTVIESEAASTDMEFCGRVVRANAQIAACRQPHFLSIVGAEDERLIVGGANKLTGRVGSAVATEEPGEVVERTGGKLVGGERAIRHRIGFHRIRDRDKLLPRCQCRISSDLDLQPLIAVEGGRGKA